MAFITGRRGDGKISPEVDNYSTSNKIFDMKSVTIAEFKKDLPALLKDVAKGESILLQKGRSRENVAILTPFKAKPGKPRELGILSRRGKLVFHDWSMSEDDFITSR